MKGIWLGRGRIRPGWVVGRVPVPLSLLSHLGQVADPEWDTSRHALATVSAHRGGAPSQVVGAGCG